jgi:hypothetical protein
MADSSTSGRYATAKERFCALMMPLRRETEVWLLLHLQSGWTEQHNQSWDSSTQVGE